MENQLIILISMVMIGFVVGWICSKEWVTHRINQRGWFRFNMRVYKCYEQIDEETNATVPGV